MLNPSKRLSNTFHSGVVHHLGTLGQLGLLPFWRLDVEKLAAAKVEFAALERDGIVQCSDTYLRFLYFYLFFFIFFCMAIFA